MKKRVLAMLLMVCMLFQFFPVTASAASVTASGSCGDNATWKLTSDGTMTISGSGNMVNYEMSSKYPWYDYSEQITSVVIGEGITNIGDTAFCGYDNLTSVTISDSVTTIGYLAFYDIGLTTVTIPDSVTCIETSAFACCDNLTKIQVGANNENYSSDSSGVLFNKDKTVLMTAPGGISGEYTIPSGVITIGQDAFRECKKLTSLTIPASITTIENMAFYNMISLTGFHVDKNNKYYSSDSRGVLFDKDKTQLMLAPMAISGSYSIPKGVTTIDARAFDHCDKLTGVTIPDGVTTLSELVFQGCTSLTQVSLPGSITNIHMGAFQSCTKLRGLTIPDSVVSIEDSAFCCMGTSLDECEFIFLGEAPIFGEDVFLSVTGTVYYPDYCSTWTSDVMQDYGGTMEWVAGLRTLTWTKDPRSYTVVVGTATTNMTCGTFLSGAKVTVTKVNATSTGLHEEQDKTDKKGKVQFDTMLAKPEYKRLWIEKKGYQTIQTVVNYVRNDGSVYFMEKEVKDKPYLICSVVSYSSSGTKYADLRFEPLGVAEGSTQKITTMFLGDWNGCGAGRYVLQQEIPGGTACPAIRIESSGKLTFSPGTTFKAGYPILLYMVAEDGTMSDPVRLDLRIYDAEGMICDTAGPGSMEWLTDQKLSSDHTLLKSILQLQPSISTEILPVEVKVDDKGDYYDLEVVIGDEIWEDGDKAANASELKQIKSVIQKVKKADGAQKVGKLMGEKFKTSKVRSLFTAEVKAGGYIAAKIDKDTLKVTGKPDVGMVVSVGGAFTIGRTMITPAGLPVFLEFQFGAEGSLYGSYTKAQLNEAILAGNGSFPMMILPVPTYDSDRSELILPEATLEGGVGLRSLVSVGVGGKMEHKIQLVTDQGFDPGGEISSSLFVHAKLLHVVNATFKLAESGPLLQWGALKKTKNLALYSSGETAVVSDSEDGFSLVSRDYLNDTSEWVGTPVTMLNDGNALAALQTGVLSDAAPQIHTVGDRQIMLFLMDSGERSIGNHTQLVYSVLENGTWSAPVPVWESETADIYFDSAVEDGDLVVVWQKSDTVLNETEPEALLNAMAASSEIAFAQWDDANNCFANQQFLTDNDQMDLMASVAMDGGDAVVVWATTGTDVLGGTGDYTLNQIRVENDVAGSPEELCTTDDYIVEVAAGVTENGPQAAWITSETDGTSDLYCMADGAAELVAEEGNFAGLSFHKNSFMVQDNGALYSFAPDTGDVTLLLGEDMAVSSSYQYVCNGDTETIVWYRAGDTGSLMASVYSDGAWQAPVVLLDEITDNITYMDAAVNGYGQYLVVANTADFNENGAENTALMFTSITPSRELELVTASVADADWENNTQDITLYVENTGFFPITEVTVEVTAGETVCLSKTVSVDLQSGESCNITEALDITGIEALVDASVQVSAEGDTDDTNNTETVTLGYADVSIEVDPMLYGDYEIFILNASNASNTDANVTLTVREDDAEGAVVETIDLGVVTAEEAVQYWYSVDAATVDYGDSDHKTYYFIISTDVEDLSDLDDSCLGVVNAPVGDPQRRHCDPRCGSRGRSAGSSGHARRRGGS